MDKNHRSLAMLMSTLVMGVLAAVLLVIGYLQGGRHIEGVKAAYKMTIEILPLLVLAFIVSGMVSVLIPHEVLAKWIGKESGFRGIMIGTIAGGLSPGGPYVNLPIVAALLRSGASMGTTVAFLTGWLLWAVTRLPLEVGLLGWRFTLIRIASTFFFPPIAGLIAQALVKWWR